MSGFVLGPTYRLTERLAWKRPAFLGTSRAHRQQYPTGSGSLVNSWKKEGVGHCTV